MLVSLGELLLEDTLEGNGVSGELADTLTELLNSHLVLVEVEAEEGLIVDVGLLLDVQSRGLGSVELLGDGLLRVEEILEQVGLYTIQLVNRYISEQGADMFPQCDTYGNGQVVTASKLSDLASVSERGTHDNGVVAELLVVVEDGLDGGNTRVLLLGVLLLGVSLEPVKDATDEGRDEVGVGLGSTNGLDKREHEGKVAVDAVVALENLGGLDTLPGSGNLDQDTVLGDALLTVELLKSVSMITRPT